jgi:hypothetical protein
MVMTVLDRQQFIEYWAVSLPGLSRVGSAMWAYEDACKKKSEWFTCVRPLEIDMHGRDKKTAYWQWCNSNCVGQILCYSSNYEEQQEWWGFSHHADIAFWLLKWAK